MAGVRSRSLKLASNLTIPAVHGWSSIRPSLETGPQERLRSAAPVDADLSKAMKTDQTLAGGVSAVLNFKITQSQLDGARSAYVAGFLVPAAAYVKLGKSQKAIDTVKKVMEIAPDFKQQGEELIRRIKDGDM